MTDIKIIRTKEDYEAALALLAELGTNDPAPESEEGEKIALLATLISDYEAKTFPTTLPTPLEAIRFRMEQGGLRPADLIPYMGSRSKVSEVLSGKRNLTLEMIRGLSVGLGIPAKVLIQKPMADEQVNYQSWSDALVKEMSERGYFGTSKFNKANKSELLSSFFTSTALVQPQLAWRKTHSRTSVRTDERALIAWSEYVLQKAALVKTPVKYRQGFVDLAFMQDVVRLSVKEEGPLLAQELLRKHGIVLVIARHLTKTRVDGVAIFSNKERPVIGLSLRYDRIDNFWFTLLHELAHLALHFNETMEDEIFFDELEDAKSVSIDSIEREADDLAQSAIIPMSKWEVSPAKATPTPMAAQSLADEFRIHVAVVAGYIRHKHQNYIYLNKIVNDEGSRVRHLFSDTF